MADKFLGTIQRESKRLQDLVSDLMSLSRIEAEKHDLPNEHVELVNLAERAAHDAAGSERADLLDFEASGEFTVRGDTQQLEQLVRNLVDNGFKYGAPDQPVTIRLHPQGESRVRLTVTDRGEGIAPEHIPHLTRRFYRTDPGAEPRFGWYRSGSCDRQAYRRAPPRQARHRQHPGGRNPGDGSPSHRERSGN